MRNFLRSTLATAAVIGISIPAAYAAELETKNVDKNATWVLHMDLEACRDAEVFKSFHAKKDGTNQPTMVSRWLEDRYGIEADDVDGVTMYGIGNNSADTVALINAQFDESVIRKVIERQPQHQVSDLNGVRVYSWEIDRTESTDTAFTDNEPTIASAETTRTTRKPIRSTEKMRAAFFDDMAVFATNMTTVATAIDTVKNDSGLSYKDADMLDDLPDDSPIYGAVLNYDDPSMAQKNPMAGFPTLEGLFKDVTRSCFAVSAKDDSHAIITIRNQIGSDESADRVGEVFEGLRAMANLYSEKNANETARVASSLLPELNQTGNLIEATWTVNVEQLQQIADRRFDQMSREFDEVAKEARDAGSADNATSTDTKSSRDRTSPRSTPSIQR